MDKVLKKLIVVFIQNEIFCEYERIGFDHKINRQQINKLITN